MATTPPPAAAAAAAILDTLADFTSRENWDQFFKLRGTGDSFEWYAEWEHLEAPLLSLLQGCCGGAAAEEESGGGGKGAAILVPGCGSSALSERLYDAGFRRITNIDFSRVVVADMLRRHARARPEMRWRVMDMTKMQALLARARLHQLRLWFGCCGVGSFGCSLPCWCYVCRPSQIEIEIGALDWT